MDFDEDDLIMPGERPASSRGPGPRPVTSGGQRPTTATRPMSRRGSAMTAAAGRPFSRQSSAIGGRPLGSAIGGRLGSAMHRTAVPGTASRLQGKQIPRIKKLIVRLFESLTFATDIKYVNQ